MEAPSRARAKHKILVVFPVPGGPASQQSDILADDLDLQLHPQIQSDLKCYVFDVFVYYQEEQVSR